MVIEKTSCVDWVRRVLTAPQGCAYQKDIKGENKRPFSYTRNTGEANKYDFVLSLVPQPHEALIIMASFIYFL